MIPGEDEVACMAKKATINMVAEQAGVSRGTVDRVLNQGRT